MKNYSPRFTYYLCFQTSQNVTMEHQDSYHDDWKSSQYEEQSLPRSAAEAVNQILRRAIEENSPS